MSDFAAELDVPDVPPSPSEEESAALRAMKTLLADAGAAEKAGAPAEDPMYGDEKALMRYLRARKGDPEAAAAMMRATAAWRREFGWEAIHRMASKGVALDGSEGDSAIDATVRAENVTGKMYVRGNDRRGHAALYMRSRLENTFNHDGNLAHLVYNMERAALTNDAAGTGVEKFALVIDFNGFSLRKQPPMATSLATLSILQNHYPERLGVAYLVDAPWAFNAAYSAIYPFIDPVTRQKIQFVRGGDEAYRRAELSKHFGPAVLQSDVYGEAPSEFDTKVYLQGRDGEDYNATQGRVAAPVPAQTTA